MARPVLRIRAVASPMLLSRSVHGSFADDVKSDRVRFALQLAAAAGLALAHGMV